MGADDRLEGAVDWQTLERARRIAWFWHRTHPDYPVCALETMLGTVEVARTGMPDGLFGLVVGAGLRWRVEINDRLPLAAVHATLGHEFGHTLQSRGLAAGFCEPRGGLPIVEREAHAIGALLTVPFNAVEHLWISDRAGERAVATSLCVPASYVRIRSALAVLLHEKDGGIEQASAELNYGLLHHQEWMAGVADLMAAQAESSPIL